MVQRALDLEVNYQAGIIDSHCHLDLILNSRYKKNMSLTDFILQSNDFHTIPSHLFRGAISNFIDPNYYHTAYNIVVNQPEIYASFGLLPCFSNQWDDRVSHQVQYYLDNMERVIGVGEMGLDYSRNPSSLNIDLQKAAFCDQLAIATRRALVPIIHCRLAFSDIFSILKERVAPNSKIHWHGTTLYDKQLRQLTNHFPNVYFSFSPAICKIGPRSRLALNNVSKLPLSRLLIESDAPYFNEPGQISAFPWNCAQVISTISHIMQIPPHSLAEELNANLLRLYGIEFPRQPYRQVISTRIRALYNKP